MTSMVTFEDVAGLNKQKEMLTDRLILPEKYNSLYVELVKKPFNQPKNFLFTGPPGTGKTYLASALAGELSLPFHEIPSTTLLDEYVGRGARSLREVYETKQGIIFLDELDAVGSRKKDRSDDLVVQLLFCLQKPLKPYATIAATNRVESLDSALRSRFTEIPFPSLDTAQREVLITNYLNHYTHVIDDVRSLADKFNGYDARGIKDAFIAAESSALRDQRNYLTKSDIYGQ